jgi:hypothetical protein
MPDADDIRWFKKQFHEEIEAALEDTPIDLDMIVAIACQETGHVWSTLRRKNMAVNRILALCVGDTLDADKGRKAFPQTKADLVAVPRGEAMFDIARKALVDMAEHIAGFAGAASNPNKFCHGFGVFQRDLQFFKVDPDYFLDRRYEDFDEALGMCLDELQRGLKKRKFEDKARLTDIEFAEVAIVYNTGKFDPEKGLKQGHFNGERFYGEEILSFVRLSKTVALPGEEPEASPPSAGSAVMPPPTPVAEGGKKFVIETKLAIARLRREPKVPIPPGKNVIAQLPEGQPVRAITGKKVKNFMEVETSLSGAHLRGFVMAKFLKAVPAKTEIPVVEAAEEEPKTGVVAVHMPRKSGTVTRRSDVATAHSLNEAGQPGRKGKTPAALVEELLAIVDWLAVDKASHTRYQPTDKATFCNIYVHDFCHLADAYIPRVWWEESAIVALEKGKKVEPLIGNTIFEMRANDIFRWLRSRGPSFGWRQTGTLDKLQEMANQGGLAVIVARRKEDGRSGHIVMVVPETQAHRAKRNGAGEVIAPLQSQAGESNFRFGTSTLNWWNDDRFAEAAFWIHR